MRFLFDLRPYHSKDDIDREGELEAEPLPVYDLVIRKKISKYAKRIHRSASDLRNHAHHYAASYMGLALLTRLLAIPRVAQCCENSPWLLPQILKEWLPEQDTIVGDDEDDPFRFTLWWSEEDSLQPEPKHLKTDMPEYHLFHLATEKSTYGYDPVLRQRIGNQSRFMLDIILRLTPKAMERALGHPGLGCDTRLDGATLAYHQQLFREANVPIEKWLQYHPRVEDAELGLYRAWKLYRHAGAHTSLVTSGECCSPSCGILLTTHSSYGPVVCSSCAGIAACIYILRPTSTDFIWGEPRGCHPAHQENQYGTDDSGQLRPKLLIRRAPGVRDLQYIGRICRHRLLHDLHGSYRQNHKLSNGQSILAIPCNKAGRCARYHAHPPSIHCCLFDNWQNL
jgi:hypothetical protein